MNFIFKSINSVAAFGRPLTISHQNYLSFFLIQFTVSLALHWRPPFSASVPPLVQPHAFSAPPIFSSNTLLLFVELQFEISNFQIFKSSSKFRANPSLQLLQPPPSSTHSPIEHYLTTRPSTTTPPTSSFSSSTTTPPTSSFFSTKDLLLLKHEFFLPLSNIYNYFPPPHLISLSLQQ